MLDRWDKVCLAGLAAIAAGLGWWIHPGAGLIAAGLGGIAAGLLGAARAEAQAPAPALSPPDGEE